jgi:sugar lactone lactonase YvrE
MDAASLSASEFRLVCDSRSQLGESPVWSVAEQALYFVDIRGPSINRFDPATGEFRRFMQSEDSCIGLVRGGGFIAAFRSGIWRLDGLGKPVTKLADNPEGIENSRFNDGRVGPDGRFYAGTVDESRQRKATLYRYDRTGLTPLLGGLMTSNGLAFSPDGSTLYHVDSPISKVTVRQFDRSTGTISGERVLIEIPDDAAARPDGACVDAEGCYWLAIFGASVVRRYSPDGKQIAEYPVPVKCPPCPPLVDQICGRFTSPRQEVAARPRSWRSIRPQAVSLRCVRRWRACPNRCSTQPPSKPRLPHLGNRPYSDSWGRRRDVIPLPGFRRKSIGSIRELKRVFHIGRPGSLSPGDKNPKGVVWALTCHGKDPSLLFETHDLVRDVMLRQFCDIFRRKLDRHSLDGIDNLAFAADADDRGCHGRV